MPLMKGKIKNLFSFIGRAWSGSLRGKAGVIALMMALIIFVRMFMGERNVQSFVLNIWRLNGEQATLTMETDRLNDLNRHIELLKGYSPDYVSEMGLKYLNIGDSNYKILKF